jgi:hypothetical protein
MRLKFLGQNDLGVLDHYVTVKPSIGILNPMRVVPNGTGSEIIFTLFHLPDMSNETFDKDVGLVERDLRALRKALED